MKKMVINLMFILHWRLNIVIMLARLYDDGEWSSISFLSIVSVLMAASEASSSTIGPMYAPDDPTLPVPWKGLIDRSTGVLYYWNLQTNVTQYEKPASILTILPPGLPPYPPPYQHLPHQEPEIELGQRYDSEFHQSNQPDMDENMVDVTDEDTDEDGKMVIVFPRNHPGFVIVDGEMVMDTGFNIFNLHHPYFKLATVFLPSDRKADILHVRNQLRTRTCTHFALVTLVTAAARAKFKTMLKLSEQQLFTFLGNDVSLKTAMDYISYRGLMLEEDCPWIGSQCTLPIPVFPLSIFRASFVFVPEVDFFKILKFQPIVVLVAITESVYTWAKGGFRGICKYLEAERDFVSRAFCRNSLVPKNEQPKLHAITIVGGWGGRGQQFYYAHDSHGTKYNFGYRKYDRNMFWRGWIVDEVHVETAASRDDPIFRRLDSSHPLI